MFDSIYPKVITPWCIVALDVNGCNWDPVLRLVKERNLACGLFVWTRGNRRPLQATGGKAIDKLMYV